MDTGIKVGDLMTRSFVHVSPDTDLKTCAKTMVKKRVGSLLITEDDKLKGILTEKDIIWAVVKKSYDDLENIRASNLMKRKVTTIKPGADITDAMKKFKKKKIRRLPVVEKKKLIGLITANDILRIDPGLFQAIAETIKIKEEKSKFKRHGIEAKRKSGICEECGIFELLYKDEAQWLCEECYTKR
ncbi:CBS domain-containing protein [archaeon]|nr:CBS domain-containing protein [archaeon]MBT7128496.1 CBS domain-containing protein [archaeon]